MKKRKKEKFNFTYKYELIGLILLILSIIGIGRYGLVGQILSAVSILLMGEFWYVFLMCMFLIGGYMIIKSEKLPIFTIKNIGIFFTIIALLTLFSVNTTNNVLNENIDKAIKGYLECANNNVVISNLGSGVIGSYIAEWSIKLFDIFGTKLISTILLVAGIVMFTGISIFEIIKAGISKTKNKLIKKKSDKVDKNDVIVNTIDNNENNQNEKIVISSISDLTKKSPNKEEEKEEVKDDIKDDVIHNEEVSSYKCPSTSLISHAPKNNNKNNEEAIKVTIPILTDLFNQFGIESKVVKVNIGPNVTQYEMEIKAGTKLSRILGLNREIALALAAKDVRIQAPIPGKRTIGVEIPHTDMMVVSVREILESVPKTLDNSKLLAPLGRDIMGNPFWMEINKTPHLLVAGSTGSGKSVCINSIITSILMRSKPNEVKLVLVDPKKVELSMYNGVPHLLVPVVTEPRRANIALKRMVSEMERRYDIFEKSGTKNITGYNEYVEKKNKTLNDLEKIEKIPYIVIIIDELADLMLVAAKEVEDSIMRITQMARAAGIHLIVATQRPSTDIITGTVKTNIPCRISFAVSSSIDSRTILDMTGAEKLLGKGDMLYLPQGESVPVRIQGTFISDEDIKKVVDFTIKQQKAKYHDFILVDEEEVKTPVQNDNNDDYEEPLYQEIVEFVVTSGKASTSLLQRRFRLGYNRAARCIDLLEERGIVGPSNGSKPREVLVKLENNDE